jgi:hypothetical protein
VVYETLLPLATEKNRRIYSKHTLIIWLISNKWLGKHLYMASTTSEAAAGFHERRYQRSNNWCQDVHLARQLRVGRDGHHGARRGRASPMGPRRLAQLPRLLSLIIEADYHFSSQHVLNIIFGQKQSSLNTTLQLWNLPFSHVELIMGSIDLHILVLIKQRLAQEPKGCVVFLN